MTNGPSVARYSVLFEMVNCCRSASCSRPGTRLRRARSIVRLRERTSELEICAEQRGVRRVEHGIRMRMIFKPFVFFSFAQEIEIIFIFDSFYIF